MNHLFAILLVSVGLGLGGCAAHTKVPVPTVAPVKIKINKAAESSERTSVEIRKFKSKAEQIDYKATRALELF